jgi:hypothetical protein
MKLILIPLLILILFATINQLLPLGSQTINFTSSTTTAAYNITGNQTLDATTSVLTNTGVQSVWDINMTAGIIALIIALVAVGVAAGITVLGSGLSNFSVQLIYKSATYYGLWGVFSALGFVGFLSIPIFGLMLWLILTLIYSVGFFQSLNVGGT